MVGKLVKRHWPPVTNYEMALSSKNISSRYNTPFFTEFSFE